MTREQAKRKFNALRNMTEARGCTKHEAATAAHLASTLAKKWGFGSASSQRWRPDFDSRFARAEQRAAARWNWEYRKCGKTNCHCSRASTGRGHGPYKYAKRREGAKVRSVYIGR